MRLAKPIVLRTIVSLVALSPALAGLMGAVIGSGFLHPMRLNAERTEQVTAMLQRTSATKEGFAVRTSDGVALQSWKVRPTSPNGDWVLLFHGMSDNRTGMLGPAEFLLRYGYSIVMMDARGHGKSGGDMVTYGWKERHDTVDIVNVLEASEQVRHLYALGVSMGAAVALQSAAIEPRIEAVIAEDPFANLREVGYDYAGLNLSPLLGKTLFRPAVVVAMHEIGNEGGFNPDDVSPEQAVAQRAFSVLLICGTADHRIPCRHAARIYNAARGPKELWIAQGAGHVSAFGHAPDEYEHRVIALLQKTETDSALQ